MINVDLILIICVCLGFLGGIIRGWWRSFIGALILVAVTGILYFGLYDFAWQWMQYDSLEFLAKTFNFDLSYTIEEFGLTIRLTNIKDTFLYLQNVGLDPVLLNATSEGVSKSLVGIVGFLIIVLGSFLFSIILYWALLKWIMPKKLRKKGLISRLIGGIIGAVELGAICLIFLQFTGNLIVPLENVILPELTNKESELYQLLISAQIAVSDIDMIVNIMTNVSKFLNPISQESNIVRALYENLNNMGLSPFNTISVNVIDENGAKVEIPFKDAFTDMLDNLVEVGVGKLNTLLGA